MQNTRIFCGICASSCLFLLTPACSSSSSVASNVDASASDAGSVAFEAGSGNCVPPGTPNNELGLGGYCTTAADCPGTLCSALHGAPDNAWFCTQLCALDPNCGTGETCVTDPRGTACVPNECIGDAGAD